MRDEIKYLQNEIDKANEKLASSSRNDQILANLFERGIIDKEGKLLEEF